MKPRRTKEDLIFAKRTEEAWKRYEKGEFVEMDFDTFLKKLKKANVSFNHSCYCL